MRAALIISLLLAGCLEVVDHTPPGTMCLHDHECPCGQDCSVTDAGLKFCGARVTHGCTIDHDCSSTGRPPHCLELSRDGGACGYLTCQ